MVLKVNLNGGARKLATRAAQAELIAQAAQRQKVLAKADMRAARKSLECAKKAARRADKKARVAAQKARRK
jgi:hypothetical protein